MDYIGLTIPTKREFQDTVNNILNSNEYKHLNNGFQDYIQNLKEKIEDWIINLLQKTNLSLGHVKAISGGLSTIFIIIIILVIISAIILIIVKYRKVKDRKNRIKEILGEKIDEDTTPISLRKKAAASLETGDYRQAVRYDFIALLLLMHEKNVLYLDETKTNEEIYDYLRRNNFQEISIFRRLVNLYNYTWYGHKILSSENHGDWQRNLDTIWNGVMSCEEE